MRWVICALVALVLPPGAYAADLDVLRGSQTVGPAYFTNWSGFYVGGQFGYGNGNTDFSRATQPLIAFSLRELALENEQAPSMWPVLGRASADAKGYGGFAGYNMQWQDLVLGVEANYTHSLLTVTSPSSPISRQTSAGGNTYDVTVVGTGTVHITDFAQVRARAGWVFGNLLPYGFAGLVLGRGDYSVTSLVFGQQNPSSPPIVPCDNAIAPTCVDFAFSNSITQNSAILYGFSAGAGLDFKLTPNFFLRGELEYVQFAPLANIVASITSARVGAGVKF
jgi:opacity protein-like surface antigen